MKCILLHSSGYSSVFLGPTAGHKDAGNSVFKVYNKDYPLQARHWLNISREVCILSRLQDDRVDGVVQLLSVADTAKHFSLQFTPCLGGNLYQGLQRRECCNEQELCVKVIIPLLHVLDSLHSRGIIHRDIKPENILFEADGKLVLGDFGLAIDSLKDKPCSRVGTQDFMAPEVLAQPSAETMATRNIPTSMLTPYGTAVDIWAVGTLVHEALTGKVPFYHPEPSVMAFKAQFGRPNRLPEGTSPECQAFVDAVLQQQAAKRPSAAQLLQHPWLCKHAGAAAAAIAARVKAKFLAELQLQRMPVPSTPCSAHVSPATNSSCRAHPTPARIPAVDAGGSSHSTCGAAAGARAHNDYCIVSCAELRPGNRAASTSSSSCADGATSSSSSKERTDSSCCCSSQHVPSDTFSNGSSPASANSQGPHAQQRQAQPGCPCKQHKVSCSCAELQPHEQQCQGPTGCAAALKAAAAAGANCANVQRQAVQLRASPPGLAQAGCASGAAGADSQAHSAGSAMEPASVKGFDVPLLKQMNLLPALSEPMLVEVPSARPGSDGVHTDCAGYSLCGCCSSPGRSCQSSTCSAAVTAATSGAPQTKSLFFTAISAGTGDPRHALPCAHDGDCVGGADGCAQATVWSAPAHTGVLQKVFSAGPPARYDDTLTGPSDVHRVVQSVPPAVAASAGGQQKPPLLKASTTSGPAQGGGGAPSPKLMLVSPPRPAVLMQRLCSLAVGKAHTTADSASTAQWGRRCSYALTAAGAVATAADPGPCANSDSAAAMDPPESSGPPPALCPPRYRARQLGGLASPLAVLSKLSGFLSPPSTSVLAAVGLRSQSAGCTAHCCEQGQASAGPERQRGAASAEGTGTAAMIVGQVNAHEAHQAAWARQELGQPAQGCRGVKGVCKKALNQVLRHKQQA